MIRNMASAPVLQVSKSCELLVSVRLIAALALWPLFVKPALEATPSALSHIPNGSPPLSASSDPPQFSERHFDQWIEFMTKKGKAVSKDTWSLLFDFIRTIDAGFKDYDETGESRID